MREKFLTVLTIAFALVVSAPASAFTSSLTSAPTASPADVCPTDSADYDLMKYIGAHVISQPIDPTDPSIPKYNRRDHFGGWVHQDAEVRCHDTREQVLARDADPQTPLAFKPPTQCVIMAALWHEPYTGSDVTMATGIQIDHVVPLRNAYYAGAYGWRPAVRCHYANFLANNFHLLAVSGHENMKKSDHGPEDYLPPNHAYRCEYLAKWLRIKTIWQLTVTAAEWRAIQATLDAESCPSTVTHVTTQWLDEQRGRAAAPIAPCEEFERNSHAPSQNPNQNPDGDPNQDDQDPGQNPPHAPQHMPQTPAQQTTKPARPGADPGQSPVQTPENTGWPTQKIPARVFSRAG